MPENTKINNPALSLVITSGISDLASCQSRELRELSPQKPGFRLAKRSLGLEPMAPVTLGVLGSPVSPAVFKTVGDSDSDDINRILFDLHKKVYSDGVIYWGTIAPIVFPLLPNLISAVPEAVNGIKKFITGSGLSGKEEEIIEAINLLEENGFIVMTR